ncbi:MAG: TraB/GumN family protein [Gammaproteobacteria bacterium]|nr:TraB/GumN family protein [Gammaproteobacteria bacterium]
MALLTALAVVWAAPEAALAGPYDHGLLWKVSSPGGVPSHLFGTIHSDAPEVLELPAAVERAFKGADSFTMEMVPSGEAMFEVMREMANLDGPPLERVVGPALYEQVVAAARARDIPAQALSLMKPWAVVVMLSRPQGQGADVLDLVLYRRAQQAGKPVHGLETAGEQIAVFNDLPLERQIDLLRATVEEHDTIPAMLEQTQDAYLERDLAQMLVMHREELDDMDPRLARLFNRRLLDERNARMVERMLPRLREGNAFIAVGALHLPGQAGVLRRLEQRGFRLEAVY